METSNLSSKGVRVERNVHVGSSHSFGHNNYGYHWIEIKITEDDLNDQNTNEHVKVYKVSQLLHILHFMCA